MRFSWPELRLNPGVILWRLRETENVRIADSPAKIGVPPKYKLITLLVHKPFDYGSRNCNKLKSVTVI
jgi:hypothetical protein